MLVKVMVGVWVAVGVLVEVAVVGGLLVAVWEGRSSGVGDGGRKDGELQATNRHIIAKRAKAIQRLPEMKKT